METMETLTPMKPLKFCRRESMFRLGNMDGADFREL